MAISITHTFSPNTTIQSSQVNANFSLLATRAVDKTGDTMTGNLLFTDATYDIGASGATRPRDLFLSRNAVVGGTIGVTGAATLSSTLALTGALTLTAGQIIFPASQNAAAGANTLDDYEEGLSSNSWVPVIGGSGGTSGQTYTTQVGSYVKIGRLVVASYTALLSAKGTITGDVQIQGLPFTAVNVTNLFHVQGVAFVGLVSNWIDIQMSVQPNTTTATLIGTAAAGTANATKLATADIANTSQMSGTIVYFATA